MHFAAESASFDINIKTIAEKIVTRHVDLKWNVDFTTETISGEAVLRFDIVAKEIEQIVSCCKRAGGL